MLTVQWRVCCASRVCAWSLWIRNWAERRPGWPLICVCEEAMLCTWPWPTNWAYPWSPGTWNSVRGQDQ